MKNWAGNYEYQAAALHEPTTLDEVREIVARSPKVKALGTRHCFHGIADTPGDLISLRNFDRPITIAADRRTVTCGAGVTYGRVCGELARSGLALQNMASLPHISVGGAVATATHGSGVRNPCLAAAVSGLRMVTADGSVVELSRDRDGQAFNGMVVALGGLGVVTELTLDVVPAFEVRQDVYVNLPLAEAVRHFDDVVSSAYSVSLFTDWKGPAFNQVWFKSRTGDGPHFDVRDLGATPAGGPRHPVPGGPAGHCTAQGEPGPSHERLPHFRLEFTPSVGEELQSEYVVPREMAAAALTEVAALADRIAPLLEVSEVRTIAADELWMSPCFGRASVALHFTWKKDPPAVEALLPDIEQRLEPFGARPHWGKVFTMPPQRLRSMYPKAEAFRQLLRRFDPQGKFHNPFLEKYVL